MKNIIEEIKDMALKQEQEESGFSPSSGTYRSKWLLPQAHASSSSSFPLYLFSRFPSHPASTTKPALIDATTGHSLTFAELRSLTVSVADSLRSSLGVNKGDVVLLVSTNSVHFPAILLAIMSLGAVFSTTNFLNTTEEIQAQVHDLNPVLIVTTQVLQTKLQGLVSSPPLLIIESFVASLALQERPPCRNMPRAEEIASRDTAMVLYSSGTTGRSKGAILSHGSMIAISAAVGQVWTGGAGTAADHVHMCVAPLFHMYGIAMLLCGAIGVGSTGVVMSKYETGKMVAAAERYGVTRVTLTPPVIVQMVKLVAGERRRVMGTWGSVKEVISSGAPLAKEYLNRFRKSFPNITLSQSYGLTEVGPVTLCDGLESRSDASVGRLIPSLEARVVDIGTRKALPPNKCGELHVRGPSLMRGYWRDKEATSLAIDREGWLNTGDLCFIDTSGRLHVMDRIKEFIKYKAYQVSPAELEDILIAHPEISDAAVVPYEDEESGQIPVACIVRNPGSKIQAEEIISFMATKVAHYKKIRKVVFVESVPRTASGKKLRRELKAAIVGNNLLHITPKL